MQRPCRSSPSRRRYGCSSNHRRSFVGSLIGGIAETQEMLDFCAENAIGAQVEVIAADRVNEAYDRMMRSDVKYRFAIDASTF